MKIAKCAQYSGYKTGLYTSPHLVDYTERIEIDGNSISNPEFAEIIQEGFQLKDENGLKCTAFDLLTVMTFAYFRRQNVDLAVIEVGLGGALDSTNILTPEISVITSIGFDHMQFLGNSLTDIAREKGKIMKKGKLAVVGPNVPVKIMQEEADLVGSKCVFVPPATDFETADEENSRIAQTTLHLLKQKYVKITDENILKSCNLRPSCRNEEIKCPKGRILLDTGHNISALSRLFYDIMHKYPSNRVTAVMGMSADKEVYRCVYEVMRYVDRVHFVGSGHERLIGHRELRGMGVEIDRDIVGESGSVSEVLPKVIASMESEDVVVICGSFFIMKDVQETLQSLGILKSK